MEAELSHIIESRNYYSILGLRKGCTSEDLKQAYRKAAKRYHPDRCSNPKATQAFQRISEAYEVLSNQARRQEYDNKISDSRQSVHTFSDSHDVTVDELYRMFSEISPKKGEGKKQKNQTEFLSYIGYGLILLIGIGVVTLIPKIGSSQQILLKDMATHTFFDGDGSYPSDEYYEDLSYKYRKRFFVEKLWVHQVMANRMDGEKTFLQNMRIAADALYENHLREECQRERSSGNSGNPSCLEMMQNEIKI